MLRSNCYIIAVFAMTVQACEARAANPAPSDPPQKDRSSMSLGATDTARQLEGQWRLTKIADVAAPDGARMIVTGGQVDIFVGCNTISAVVMLGSGFVRFRDITTTKMACAPGPQTLETKVTEALTRIETMNVGLGDVLSFYDGMNALQMGAVSTEL